MFFGITMLVVAVVFLLLAIKNFYRLLHEKEGEEGTDTQDQYAINRRLVSVMIAEGYLALLVIGGSIPPLEGWDPGFAFMLVIMFHLIASWRKVGPTELGAILFFGRPLYAVESGLRFVPWLVCTLTKDTRLTIEAELPADPEKIYRGERDKPEVVPENLLKEGFRPPIRVTFLGISKEKKRGTGEGEITKTEETEEAVDDPLEERVTAETPLIVRWRIVDYVRFLTTIGDQEQARIQMADIGIVVIADKLPQLTVAQALQEKKEVDKTLKGELSKTTESWGIEIKDASIKSINLSHELNTELQKIAEARATRRRNKLEGEGAGAKEQATLDGRTNGLKRMREELGVSAEAVLAAETARAITSNPGQKTIIAGVAGFQEIAGVVTGIADSFRENKNGPEKGGAS